MRVLAEGTVALGVKIKEFGKTPVGFVVYLAIIVLLSGVFVGELGIPVGALLMLMVAFGFPIYAGWKTSLKKLLSVAAVVILFGPLVVTAVVTPLIITPSPIVASNDNVLSNATVSPWESNAASQVYSFHATVAPEKVNKSVTLHEVYLWVTNCAADTDTSQGNCVLWPKAPFLNETYDLTSAQQNSTSPFEVYFNLTTGGSKGLQHGQVFYFMFLTAVASVGAEALQIYSFNTHWGGWSCTTSPGYSCTYTQGPITTNWGGVYILFLPGFYYSMAILDAVLVAIILVYSYLKTRERMRQAKAKAAAKGEQGGAPLEEMRCPHCGAVVDKGEANCWKCKKDLSMSVEKTRGGAREAEGDGEDRPESEPLPSRSSASKSGSAAPSPLEQQGQDSGPD